MAQTRADKKRLQIRAAAKQLFVQHGFSGTSTDAIAAAASTSKETLYRYYPRKEDLFVDVLRSLTVERGFWAQFIEQATEPRDTRQLRDLLRRTVRRQLQTMMQPEYLSMLRLIVAESPRFPELGELFQQTVLEQGFAYFGTLFREAQRNGFVRHRVDPAIAARMVLGCLLTYVLPNGLIRTTQAPRLPGRRAIYTFVEHVMELIANDP